MQFDELIIEILPDGTIKTTTNPISAANHSTAEAFLKGIADLAGGETKREKRKDVQHTHTHSHEHGHTH